MAYETLQFIGHAMHTGPAYDIDKDKYRYVGKPDADSDIDDRIKLVGALLEIAYANAAPDPGTLKVLMLPEFYFRGDRGAYTVDQAHRVVTRLQSLVRDAKWKDWFFVFGSLIAYSYAGDIDPINDSSVHAEIYNIVPCQYGGFGGGDASDTARVVLKEALSDIDFINAPLRGLPDGKDYEAFFLEMVSHLAPARPVGEGSEVQFVNYGGEGVFDCCGLTWGVEVCLDHLVGRLRCSAGLPQLAVQLIPSCGMSIREENIALNTGWVFNVDGLNSGRHPAGEAGAAHTELVEVRAGVKRVLAPTRINLDRSLEADDLYAHGAGQLHIYQVVATTPE